MKLVIEQVNPTTVFRRARNKSKKLGLFRVLFILSCPCTIKLARINLLYSINCFGYVLLLRFSIKAEELCPLLLFDSRSPAPLPETGTFVRAHESKRRGCLLERLRRVERVPLFSFVRRNDAFSHLLLMANGNKCTEQSHCYSWIFKKARELAWVTLFRSTSIDTYWQCEHWLA